MASDGITNWLAENCIEGKLVVRVGRRGDELVAEFANVGLLTLNPRNACVNFEPVLGVSSAVVERLHATVVGAFVRHAQGKVTLHGGAVSQNSGAVALVGPSRSGKSTLTAAICADLKVGFLADDTVAIEVPGVPGACVEVVPTQRAAWLLPDACQVLGFDAVGNGKTEIVPLCGETPDAAVLVAVVALVFDSDAVMPQLRRLRGQEAFSSLLDAAFRFVIDDPTAQMREFDQLRTIAERCPVYELRRSRNLGQLKFTVQLIRELLAGARLADRPS